MPCNWDGLCWTDYPLEEDLNDSGKVKVVKLLAYDTDNYCFILHEGKTHEIKSGYLFRIPAWCKKKGFTPKKIRWDKLGGRRRTKDNYLIPRIKKTPHLHPNLLDQFAVDFDTWMSLYPAYET